MKRIVVPTDGRKGLEDTVAEHFGRCSTYTFLDENGQVLEIIGNESEHMGGRGLPPELMKKHNANILLCRGIGPRAIDLCNSFGIDVYVCNAKTVKEIFNEWKSGKLVKAGREHSCEEHRA